MKDLLRFWKIISVTYKIVYTKESLLKRFHS